MSPFGTERFGSAMTKAPPLHVTTQRGTGTGCSWPLIENDRPLTKPGRLKGSPLGRHPWALASLKITAWIRQQHLQIQLARCRGQALEEDKVIQDLLRVYDEDGAFPAPRVCKEEISGDIVALARCPRPPGAGSWPRLPPGTATPLWLQDGRARVTCRSLADRARYSLL
jgi:hypothetical protein